MYRKIHEDTWGKFDIGCNGKKVVIWGAGKYCEEEIEQLCIKYEVKYIVDSDKKKWGNQLNGIKICDPQVVITETESIVILICSIYAGAIASQLEEMGITDYYCLFWMKNRELAHLKYPKHIQNEQRLKEVEKILHDEKSKYILRQIIQKRKEEKVDYTDILSVKEYFVENIFEYGQNEIYVDVGAYDGDTIESFINEVPHFKKIYAYEADKKNYSKLCNSEVYNMYKEKIEICNMAILDKKCEEAFLVNLDTSSQVEKENELNEWGENAEKVVLECVPLDDVLKDEITFIKMDIEGSELRALYGASNIIKKYRPKMAICIYHKPDDLWKIPLYIKTLVPEYKFYIRHHSMVYTDTVLYVTL